MFPPDNELPAPLDVGPLIWRSADVGISVTGFLVYTTGVAFTAVVLSKGPSLRSGGLAEEGPAEPVLVDLGAESLKFGARQVPLTFNSWGRNEHRLKIEAWAPFPADGDLDFYVEWPAE